MSRFYEECPKCGEDITKHKPKEGETEIARCPKCGVCLGKTLVMSRVTGFHTNINNWNKGKKEEYKERKEYKVGKML